MVSGIALYSQHEAYDFGTATISLVYAEINGIKHGTRIPGPLVEPRDVPVSVNLFQNYPNPFNPTTVITYDIATRARVILTIYDVLGRQVATLVNGEKSLGRYRATFNGSGLPSGVYFYRLQAGDYSATKKLMMVKREPLPESRIPRGSSNVTNER